MNNLEEKEKKLNGLIDRLSNLSHSYSQSSYEAESIKTKKNQLVDMCITSKGWEQIAIPNY